MKHKRLVVAVSLAILFGCSKEPALDFRSVLAGAKDNQDAVDKSEAFVAGIDDPDRLMAIIDECERDHSADPLLIMWTSCVCRLSELKTGKAIEALVALMDSGKYDAGAAETILDALTCVGPPAIPYLEKAKSDHRNLVIDMIRKGEHVF